MLSQHLKDSDASNISKEEQEALVKEAIAQRQNFAPWQQNSITVQKIEGLSVFIQHIVAALVNSASSVEGKEQAFLFTRDLRMLQLIGRYLTTPGGVELLLGEQTQPTQEQQN